MDLEIINDRKRFYVKTANGDAELLYRIEENRMIIYKTYVPIKQRGRGIATRLANAAFEYAEKNKLEIIKACEFIKKYKNKKR